MLKKNIAVIVLALIVFSFLSFIGWQYTNLFSDDKIKPAIIPDYQAPDVNSYIARFGKNNKISICKFDLLNPEVVNIYKDPDNPFGQIFTIYTKIKRSNILDIQWQIDGTVNDGESSEIYDMSFDAVVKEYQQKGCDAFKKNINKVDNIKIQGEGPVSVTYNPPISDEERKRLDEEQKTKNANQDKQATYDKLSVSQKVAHWQFELIRIYNGLLTATPDILTKENIMHTKEAIKQIRFARQDVQKNDALVQREYDAYLDLLLKDQEDLVKYRDINDSEMDTLLVKY